MPLYRHFLVSFGFTIAGLAGAFWLGHLYSGTIDGALSTFFICSVLAILEISLSFDNAIVNATVLAHMSEKWQKRFLTWGILFAVFGMRIVFPLAIASVAARMDPWSALKLAALHPEEYAAVMHQAQTEISAFGGAFLMMVAFKFFFDRDKEVHWIAGLERRLSRFGNVQSIEMGLVLAAVVLFATGLEGSEWASFVHAAIWGLLAFLLVEAAGKILDASQARMAAVHRAGLGGFLYLEMLDASFSFDGVVGAYALSSNLFVIAIGLGIGAFYVRSMTMALVERETLAQYRYLEHGAFYAIFFLAIIMFLQVQVHVPEVLTGAIGITLIALSFAASLRLKRQQESGGTRCRPASPSSR